MATAPVDICIVGRSRFDCDNLATLLRRHGGSPDVCIGAEDLRARAAEHGTAALVLVEAGGAAETDLLAAVDICGAAPIYAFGRDASRVSPDRLLDLGVRDFLRLPLDERLAAELVASVRALDVEIVHRHPAMVGLVALARRVGASDAPILVVGETGTGKEVIAREIHAHGRRKTEPFVAVNCAAIPEALLESELFGHVKGAFTGAVRDRPGRFAAADGGTLLLDEIGDLPLDLQSKLLRVLQESTFEPVGGDRTVRADVRVLAATHVDLPAAIAAGRFREDLYYRLAVFPVTLPPLRDRLDDLPELAAELLVDVAARAGRRGLSLGADAIDRLAEHGWPGNVRELANVLERAAILCTGTVIGAAHVEIPGAKASASTTTDGAEPVTMAEASKVHIARALELSKGRIYGPKGAAARLGLKPSTLQSRMKKLGMRYVD